MSPKNRQRVRDTPILTVRSSTKAPTLTTITYYAEDLSFMISTSVSLSPYEPCLCGSVRCVLLESTTPLTPTILPSLFPWDSLSSKGEGLYGNLQSLCT